MAAAEPEILGARAIRFCFSDGSVDRAGDSVDPAGWELQRFMQNPVALWAHDSSSPPVGRARNVGIVGSRLMGDIEFAARDVYEFADTIYRLVAGGFIRAVSVGFMPLEYAFADDADRPWGIDFKRQELLEISVCPVPMNANALVEARAKGIDTSPLVAWTENKGRRHFGGNDDDDQAARRRLSRTVERVRGELAQHAPPPIDARVAIANASFRLFRL